MKLVASGPSGQWLKATTVMEKLIAKAEAGAMQQVGKAARDAGRAAIAAAGFSSKFANSLVVKTPRGNSTLNPFAYVHTTINYADVFEKGAAIAGIPFIWLPLPNVPPIAGRPHMTPSQYIQNVGRLVFMRRPGKPPMLGARVTSARGLGVSGKASKQRLRRGVAFGRGQVIEVVPLFVGISSVNIPVKFDATGAIKRAASPDNVEQAYLDNLEEYKDPNGN